MANIWAHSQIAKFTFRQGNILFNSLILFCRGVSVRILFVFSNTGNIPEDIFAFISRKHHYQLKMPWPISQSLFNKYLLILI